MEIFSRMKQKSQEVLSCPKPREPGPRSPAAGHRLSAVAKMAPKLDTDPLVRSDARQADVFKASVRPFERAVYLIALAFVNNPSEAEEVAKQTMIRAFRSLEAFKHEEEFRAWLIRIALGEARAFSRDRKETTNDDLPKEEGADCEYEVPSLSEWNPIPLTAMKQKEARDIVTEAVRRLPQKCRVTLLMRDVLYLTTMEAAILLGVPQETIRTRLASARYKLCCGLASAMSHGGGLSERAGCIPLG